MKKIKIFLIAAMFLLVFPIGLSASENLTVDVDKAREVMDSFIDSSVNMGDDLWNGVKIVNYENIYDVDLNHYGYVFELSNGIKEGYGIVVKSNDRYFVVEASDDGESPYTNYEGLNIYFTPLEYYGFNNASLASSENVIINLVDGSTLLKDEVRTKKISVSIPAAQSYSAPHLDSYKYITDYVSKFEKHGQTQPSSCIPASFAMSLKYLHNMGSLTLKSPYTNMANIEDKLFTLANCTGDKCLASNITSAVKTFSDNYITGATIRTRDDGFGDDARLSIARDEVDANCPPIVMFKKGAIDTSENVEHATTMVGYKNIIDGNSTIMTDYIIIVDPVGAKNKTVLWNSDKIYGYMLIYFY